MSAFVENTLAEYWNVAIAEAVEQDKAALAEMSEQERTLHAIVNGVLKDHPEIMREALMHWLIHGNAMADGSMKD